MKRFWLPLLFAPSVLIAQDWNPVLHGRKYNYKPDTAQFIQFGIWIDSVKWNGSDSVYHLNRIVTDCDTCPIPGSKHYDQGTFMNRLMQVRSDGSFWLHDPGSLLLRSNDSVNSSWLFDTAQNITATIVSFYEDSLWGITDSFKTIVLSTDDTIIIGKNLGIVRFPTTDSTINYILTGIDMGQTDWGETVIDFWDIYDFQVGDIFQQFDGWLVGGIDWPGDDEWCNTTWKTSFLSKDILIDGYRYDGFYYSEITCWHEIPGVYLWKCYSDSSGWEFRLQSMDGANAYPGELATPSFSEHTLEMDVLCTYHLGVDPQGRRVKSSVLDGVRHDAYFTDDYPVLVPVLQSEALFAFESSFGEGMGMIRSYLQEHYYVVSYSSSGRFNGDTTGQIVDDQHYIDCIKLTPVQSASGEEPMSIRPNPATRAVTLSANSIWLPFSVLVSDVTGRRIISSTAVQPETQLDLSSLPPGLYILTATSTEGQLLWSTKVVKQ